MSTRSVLLTGATGYLGCLIAKTLLMNEDVELVTPVRRPDDLDGFWGPIRTEIIADCGRFDPALIDRVHVVQLPPIADLDELSAAFESHGVDEIVHCAGCVDYFDTELLVQVNVGLTRQLLGLGSRHGVQRFVYISTAFSSGYLDNPVPETLHTEPEKDPTEYTRTKREAEHAVAASGLPYQILRPPIVIGNSRDGRYGGKRYGVYQLWAGMERLLFGQWHPEVHYVAPHRPMPLLHEDAFQDAFLGAYRHLPDGTIFNMTSNTYPDLRDVADLWYRECMAPERIVYYDRLADVPLLHINRRQRAFLGMASTNIAIASHQWEFESSSATSLRRFGVDWAETTLESLALCQRRFVRSSEKITQFISENSGRFDKVPEVVELCLESAS